ncbi:16S rRNA (guanine(966)-N(2))-methyltransferase RsmD [Cypionkella sp.]|uniref:16S rRNA (guanine(966)-N(2))-methyltransferase RsmD n=1 Tax=Cypionkella sp. TaxID=2811411 RepID=UPI002720E7C2|nr:16S rRNA (guanine(966)-N(2))-methyltransferase RsmD [Cypionkella sp.]MDO8985031.1 16S rRNA (guanine(966)-N(2))-methyltransferase RsmD [Cypionkella sp.]MDP2047412.1 16S rRNA (guanine(966)-N(2))-methyltransferase RsmD [Cypionkella sp.]
MRIIGGSARGLHLTRVGVGDAQAHLRPTSDRVRESIFNLLINGGYGNPLQNARVLDVFAGTGALGLEALSRGASSATFLENGAAAAPLLKRNIALMRTEDRCEILRRDATKPGLNPGAAFEVIFLDPPYGKAMGELALTALTLWLAPEALVIWEESTKPVPPAGFEFLDQRKYGDTLVTILKAPA